ncbi:hypothetical protein DPMN_074176 [Dreissena polymorpha]|uniref:Uncharacterized protein n=1 Tax=Dreissena polymorpha TaxID=45954 RepID=A0A9D3YH67_DREPO|nr:hypothetical protein DPMN_074176 [Dreissena polymorpha]
MLTLASSSILVDDCLNKIASCIESTILLPKVDPMCKNPGDTAQWKMEDANSSGV